MKLLLDECIDYRLLKAFRHHEVAHVRDLEWHTLKNGELLRRADSEFDLLVTVDRNMEFQSSLKGLSLAVAVFAAPNNRLETLLPLVEALEQQASEISPGTFHRIS